MQPGPLRWIVLFFTRPIHIADVKSFLRALKPRPKPAAVAAAEPDKPAERRPSRPRPAGSDAARPAGVAARDTSMDVAISEQPLDTLPADLQSEFGVSVPAAADAAPAPTRPPSGADA